MEEKVKINKKAVIGALCGAIFAIILGVTIAVVTTPKEEPELPSSTNPDAVNINTGTYDSSLAIDFANFDNADYLDSLNDRTKAMVADAIGSYFCVTSEQAKNLKGVFTSKVEQIPDTNSKLATMKAEGGSDMGYSLTIYDSRVVITELIEHVDGVNDEVFEQNNNVGQTESASNEGTRWQADTTGNIFVTDKEKVQEYLPASAAAGLEDTLKAWAKQRNIELDIYDCSMNPDDYKEEGSKIKFSVLCSDTTGNYILVDAVYNPSNNSIAYSQYEEQG